MQGNRDDEDDKKPTPPPFFPGSAMFTPSLGPMDDGEEITRKVGGFTPSFAPSNITFEPPPMMAPLSHTSLGGPSAGTFSTASSKVAAQASSRPSRFRWTLQDAPSLPEFHQLERTAVFVPHTPPTTVAGRISDVFRERSIEASFDDTKGRAKCVSADGVDFRVHLYRGRNQYNHGIIVEVQRRFGTSINFHSETQAILDAAEGKTPVAPPKKPASLPLFPEDDGYKAQAGSSLSMVSKMLSFPGYDAQYLALQTLTSLTDPEKMGLATSRTVSIELLNGHNDVGGKLLMMILSPPKDQEESFDLRVRSMVILSNVLQVAGAGVPEGIRMQLRPVLKQDLRRAEINPRLATIAAKCVEHLIDYDRMARDIYYDALQTAVQVGTDRHAGLMRQAERCLQKI